MHVCMFTHMYTHIYTHIYGSVTDELQAKKQRMATTFRQLKPLFTNSHLSLAWKKQMHRAIILGQLTYGLGSLWVPASEIKALHKLYLYQLRVLAGIPHPYYSRVSNSQVLARTAMPSMSNLIKAEQFHYAGHLPRLPAHCWHNKFTWTTDFQPIKPPHYSGGRRGRRSTWTHDVSRTLCQHMAGPHESWQAPSIRQKLKETITNRDKWIKVVRRVRA